MGKTKRSLGAAERRFRDLLRSRHTLIWIESGEERRVETAIAAVASEEGFPAFFWDCATGAVDVERKRVDIGGDGVPEINPHAVFDKLRSRAGSLSGVWVMRDLQDWLDPMVTRALKSLARDLQEEMDPARLSTIVILAPVTSIPISLRAAVTTVDWPLPGRDEIGRIVGLVSESSSVKVNGDLEPIVDAAAGLAADDIESALSLSIVQHGRMDASEVASAKRAIVNREGLVQWYDPDPRGLDGVGGLSLLKEWLLERSLAFTPEARAYGLPPVKGALLVGPSGTGKSLVAKCVAVAFGIPLLRLDLGALKAGIVGASEGNIRRALRTAEAVTRCVLWLDEVEKAIAGARGPSLDGGTSSDQLGTLLTWMQESTLPIFTLATSNDPTALPPELVSRFDDTFFVDLPDARERAEILAKTLALHRRAAEDFDLAAVAAATELFSGRELAQRVVGGALFRAFADSRRPVETRDFLAVASNLIPVAKSAAETVSALRKWAEGRARPASAREDEPARAAGFGRLLKVAGPAEGAAREER